MAAATTERRLERRFLPPVLLLLVFLGVTDRRSYTRIDRIIFDSQNNYSYATISNNHNTSTETAGNPLTKTPYSWSAESFLADYQLPSWYSSTAQQRQHPTPNIPFVLFHQRKTGGSTIREQLKEAATNTSTKFWMPCFDGVNCEAYSPSPRLTWHPHVKSIYGGHIYYPSFASRTWMLSHDPNRGKPQLFKESAMTTTKPQFTCLTIFREPLSRIVSCWNYRMVQAKRAPANARPLAQMDPAEIPQLLTTSRSLYGEGCLNEPMRIFSTVGWDENAVNRVDYFDHSVLDSSNNDSNSNNETKSQRRDPFTPEAIVQDTIQNVGNCIVGILERPEDTMRNIQRHLPWLAPYLSFAQTVNAGEIRKGNLTAAAAAAIRSVSRSEQRIYDLAHQLMDRQLLQASPTANTIADQADA